jgi:hypothetical protein
MLTAYLLVIDSSSNMAATSLFCDDSEVCQLYFRAESHVFYCYLKILYQLLRLCGVEYDVRMMINKELGKKLSLAV